VGAGFIPRNGSRISALEREYHERRHKMRLASPDRPLSECHLPGERLPIANISGVFDFAS
jgi:hypothetical protein